MNKRNNNIINFKDIRNKKVEIAEKKDKVDFNKLREKMRKETGYYE